MKSSELNQRRQQATPRGVGVMCNYFVEKAENATLWDIEGNEVIDFAAGIAVSLFAHFALLIAPRPPEPEPSFTTVVQMDMASPAVATSREKGIGIAAASPRDMDKADAADRKRQAFLRYLDDIDEAVHARRLDGGETGLIGVAEYMFTVRPDGTFTDPVLRASSGSPQLDASARRAVLAASGKVRRPAIIGTEPIPVILHIKYQYGLR